MVTFACFIKFVLLFPSYCLTQTSERYVRSLGDTVILSCRLQRESDPIVWDFHINTTLSNQYSTDNRTNPSLEGISERLSIKGNYDLEISSVQKEDEGTYECKTTINGMKRQHFAIFNLIKSSKEYFHILGDTVILVCTFQRKTDPMIWEFRFNTTLTKQYSTDNRTNPYLEGISERLSIVGNYDLQILTIGRDDEGTYECKTTINGIFIQHLAILSIVITPSRIYFHGSMNNKLEGTEGTDLLIRCIADGGKPPPYVSILDGTKRNHTQEVSNTIPNISRDYHQKSIVCQATGHALVNPMTTTVQINLNLKPLIPIFHTYKISTEETVPLTVSCTSYGSRPVASFTWTIGGNNVTSSSTISQIITESNDTNTVTSTLRFNVNKTHNKQSIICHAFNTVGSVSASKTLDVKYAPDITVNSPTYTQNDADRTVTCNPRGNPDNYTYHKWQHRSKYGEIIREFGGNKTLKLPDIPVLSRYQDNGEYVCTASNGVKDRDNQIEQTGFGYITMNAQPVFTSDTNERVKQFGEIEKDVDIYLNIYSIPKFNSFEWSRNGKPISTQNFPKYESTSSPTIVKHIIHGKEVQLDGYNITLTVHDLEVEDFTIYTVTLKNIFGNIIYPIILESSSVPETPGNFSRIKSSATSLTVQWDPQEGGGYKQLFYIQYRVQGVLEWTTALVGEEDINESKGRTKYELRNLEEGKTYELRMYVENTAGKRSNVTDVLIIFTESSESSSVTSAVIAGGASLVIVCASVTAIMLLKWRQGKNKTRQKDKHHENITLEALKKGDEYEEIGIISDMEEKKSTRNYETLDTKDARTVYDVLDNPLDVEHKQSSKTYETLGIKDALNVYDDLGNSHDVEHKQSSKTYETLGIKDALNVYDDLGNSHEPI